ncbi:uncharacterized protein [Euphorbia lathyris]|uniref:uncharacterized protein isoform X1 n=1 Tax=Euphorbia lathyris TaxID=212925 RepID=UPI0033144633
MGKLLSDLLQTLAEHRISHGETFERLTANLGRAPDPHELFMYTHTRQHDGNSWINQHVQDVEEEVQITQIGFMGWVLQELDISMQPLHLLQEHMEHLHQPHHLIHVCICSLSLIDCNQQLMAL